MLYYFDTECTSPYYNLAFEEYFFTTKQPGDSYLILWQNTNAVILGRYQNIFEEVNIPYATAQHIALVRRNSGGGAVYHDLGNLNYTYITDYHPEHTLQSLSQPLLDTLQQHGIPAAFNGRNDICLGQYKISGAAQYINEQKLLHHGTLLVHSDLDTMSTVLHANAKIHDSLAVPSVKSRVCNLEPCIEAARQRIAALRGPLLEAFSHGTGTAYPVTAADLAAIQRLEATKYRTTQWNYGYMPECNVTNRKRFAGGTVCIHALLEQQRIRHITFQGDFFARKDLQELEQALQGVSVTDGLYAALVRRKAGDYIHQVTTEDIFSLFAMFTAPSC